MNPLDRLETLPSIDLEHLNAAAELQTRVDRKYVLPLAHLPAVLAELPRGSEILEIGGERALRYASQYFDTPELDSYLGAARGRRRRFKVRARTYVDSGGSFLEVKTRGGRSATVKDRVPVTGDELDDAAVAYAADMLGDAGIPRASELAERLRPTLVTQYRRATLLLPATERAGASRGTVDVDLTWISADGGVLALPRTVIVETKSGQRAGALDRSLWRHGHRPARISKYGTGLAALHPALPANRWRRVLARHFGYHTVTGLTTPVTASGRPPTVRSITFTKGSEPMGFMDDAKETAETAGRKVKDAWEDTTDRIGDKVDEVKADANVKKAEAERDSVETRNDLKEKLRGDE